MLRGQLELVGFCIVLIQARFDALQRDVSSNRPRSMSNRARIAIVIYAQSSSLNLLYACILQAGYLTEQKHSPDACPADTAIL